MEAPFVIVLIVLAFLIFVIAGTGLRIVRPWEKGLIERLGRYQRTAGSGLTLIIPFIERLSKVDMREQVVDVPPQLVITKDNVAVEVDAVVYFEVTDPVKVTYNVENFYIAATKLAQTNLRNLIGDLALDESLTSRELINTRLRQILDEATDKWGTKVTRVELQKIEPPADVTEAMHRQMKAERVRRATILEAEGTKQAAILQIISGVMTMSIMFCVSYLTVGTVLGICTFFIGGIGAICGVVTFLLIPVGLFEIVSGIIGLTNPESGGKIMKICSYVEMGSILLGGVSTAVVGGVAMSLLSQPEVTAYIEG